MELTDPQRRTLEQLIGTERPIFAADLAQRLRDRIEEAVRGLELSELLWLGKERLNDLGRCEGMFSAAISRRGPAVRAHAATAAGVVQHRAIEVGSARARRSTRTRAESPPTDARPGGAVRGVLARAERVRARRPADGGRASRTLFEARSRRCATCVAISRRSPSFDARRAARRLARRLGQGRPGARAPRPAQPMRAQRLPIDLKTGGAYPEHAEDMRSTRCCIRFASACRPTASARSSWRAAPGRPRTSARSAVARGRSRDRGRARRGRLERARAPLTPGVGAAGVLAPMSARRRDRDRIADHQRRSSTERGETP